MTNDPKEWRPDFQERLNDRHGTYTVDDLIRDIVTDSRSRFKEEAIKALEKDIHYEESQIEDAVQEREGGTEGEIEESEIKIKALKEAIETIESL